MRLLITSSSSTSDRFQQVDDINVYSSLPTDYRPVSVMNLRIAVSVIDYENYDYI